MGKGRAPCCDKSQVKRGPWSPAEDLRLITFIQKHGHDNWRALPKQAGLLRCGKSCRLRWINYLRPDVKRGNFTQEEEDAMIKLHETLGNKWSKIASYFPGRTDNEIKNIWNTHLKKRLPLAKNSDSSGDESKESSITYSSSSSFSSNPSCGKRGLESEELGHRSDDESVPKRPCNNNDQLTIVQEKLIDDDVQKEVTNPNDQLIITSTTTTTTTTTTSSASSHASNMSNSTNTTQADVSGDDDHDQEDDQMANNLLFDFMGTYDVSDILQEVNKPGIQADLMAPLEADYEFWNMLENLGTNFLQQPNDQVQPQSSNFNGEGHKGENIESWDWIKALENELGLTGNDNQNQQLVLEDQSHAIEEQVPAEMYFHYDVVEKLPEESDPCLYLY